MDASLPSLISRSVGNETASWQRRALAVDELDPFAGELIVQQKDHTNTCM